MAFRGTESRRDWLTNINVGRFFKCYSADEILQGGLEHLQSEPSSPTAPSLSNDSASPHAAAPSSGSGRDEHTAPLLGKQRKQFRLHGGFRGAEAELWPYVRCMARACMQHVGGADAEWTLHVTGHSMGAGLATICAYKLCLDPSLCAYVFFKGLALHVWYACSRQRSMQACAQHKLRQHTDAQKGAA